MNLFKNLILFSLLIAACSCDGCFGCNLFEETTAVYGFVASSDGDIIVYETRSSEFLSTSKRSLISMAADESWSSILWEVERDDDDDSHVVNEISEYQISPDKQTVVIRGDLETNSVVRLYSIPATGGDLTELVQGVDATSTLSIDEFTFSADSSYIVFKGDIEVDGIERIYSVPIAGGSAIPLSNNDELSSDSRYILEISSYEISPDSSTVVFLGDIEVDSVKRLYSVPIAGGDITQLSQNTTDNTDLNISLFEITHDSSTVVFYGDPEVNQVDEIFSIPIEGGTITSLIQDVGVDIRVEEMAISPDDTMVAFIGDTHGTTVRRLYSVPLEGGTQNVLSQNTTSDTSFAIDSFKISNDSERIVFDGDPQTNSVVQLYSIPIEGGDIETLSFNSDDTSLRLIDYSISGDSQRVIFHGDQNVFSVDSLYSVPIEGGEIITLSQNTGNDASFDVRSYALNDASSYVVFIGDLAIDDVTDLYSVPITGGDVITLEENIDNEYTSSYDYEISGDGQSVFFIATLGDEEYLDTLYQIPIDGEGSLMNLSEN